MKKTVVIIGAGAIGRGYLPWILDDSSYEYTFVDVDPKIINSMKKNKKYSSYMVKDDKLIQKTIDCSRSFLLNDFRLSNLNNVAAIFLNVGPRNCSKAVVGLDGVYCPIILCENDPNTVDVVKDVLGYDRAYFAIPDVITSNTASEELLKTDPLSIITEDGVIFIDQRAAPLKGLINFCSKEEIEKQWTAKMYLHNTPHCIAAYLGALAGVKYVHEAMAIPKIQEIVVGAMNEMLTVLKLKWEIDHTFLDYYADKEIRRFENKLLHDPVSRVAREPLRKLELDGRLIGAAQICLSHGFIPINIIAGIVSALLFENENDADHHLSFIRNVLPNKIILNYIIGLREGEALERVMNENFESVLKKLEKIATKNYDEASENELA